MKKFLFAGTTAIIAVGLVWSYTHITFKNVDAAGPIPYFVNLELVQETQEPHVIPTDVDGDLDTGFTMGLDDTAPYHYIDAANVSVNTTLADGYYGFTLDTSSVPGDFYTYWATRGVDGGGPYGTAWDIINGNSPTFYLEVSSSGTAFMVVDGLQHDIGAGDFLLRVNGDYPLGNYIYTGTVDSVGGETSDTISIDMQFAAFDVFMTPDTNMVYGMDDAIDFSATPAGGTGIYQCNWDLNGDGSYNNITDNCDPGSLDLSTANGFYPGTFSLGVEVTDDGGAGDVVEEKIDVTILTTVASDPVDAEAAGPNGPIVLTFSGDMDPTSVDTTCTAGNPPPAGTNVWLEDVTEGSGNCIFVTSQNWSGSDTVLTMQVDLDNNNQYKIHVNDISGGATDVLDVDGFALDGDVNSSPSGEFTATFTTAGVTDVSSTTPVDAATGVLANSDITIDFSGSIDRSTDDTSCLDGTETPNIGIYDSSNNCVPLAAVWNEPTNEQVVLRPTLDLNYTEIYTIRVDGTVVEDVNGFLLDADTNGVAGGLGEYTFTVEDTPPLGAIISVPSDPVLTVMVNDNVDFNSQITGGDSPYTCNWYFFSDNPTVPNGSVFSSTCNPNANDAQYTTTGTYYACLVVTDSTVPTSQEDGPTCKTVVVNDALDVSMDTIYAVANNGTVDFSPVVSGGVGSYNYSWDFDGNLSIDSTDAAPTSTPYAGGASSEMQYGGTLTVRDTATITAVHEEVVNFVVTAYPQLTFDGIQTISKVDDTINLGWNAASGGKTPYTYNVYQRTSTGSYNFTTPTKTTSNLTTSMASMSDGSYFFTIRVSDDTNEETTNTQELSMTIGIPDNLSPPDSIEAEADDESIDLDWSGASAGTGTIAGYTVYYGTSSESSSALTKEVTSTSTTLDNLDNDKSYYIRIKTIDGDSNESDFSNEVQVKTADKRDEESFAFLYDSGMSVYYVIREDTVTGKFDFTNMVDNQGDEIEFKAFNDEILIRFTKDFIDFLEGEMGDDGEFEIEQLDATGGTYGIAPDGYVRIGDYMYDITLYDDNGDPIEDNFDEDFEGEFDFTDDYDGNGNYMLFYYDENNDEWVEEASASFSGNTVKFSPDHLTTFAVFEEKSDSTTDSSITNGDLTSTPESNSNITGDNLISSDDVASGNISCDYDRYNCSDFNSPADAQQAYAYCNGAGFGDVHNLDSDGDGIACEVSSVNDVNEDGSTETTTAGNDSEEGGLVLGATTLTKSGGNIALFLLAIAMTLGGFTLVRRRREE